MTCGALKIACDDGFQVVSKDKKELVAMTSMHLDHVHHTKKTDIEILGMAKHP